MINSDGKAQSNDSYFFLSFNEKKGLLQASKRWTMYLIEAEFQSYSGKLPLPYLSLNQPFYDSGLLFALRNG